MMLFLRIRIIALTIAIMNLSALAADAPDIDTKLDGYTEHNKGVRIDDSGFLCNLAVTTNGGRVLVLMSSVFQVVNKNQTGGMHAAPFRDNASYTEALFITEELHAGSNWQNVNMHAVDHPSAGKHTYSFWVGFDPKGAYATTNECQITAIELPN